MSRTLSPPAGPDLLALQAQHAGLALACAFSSSDEFEADIIRVRRAAGLYGPKRHHRQAAFAGVMAGAVAVLAAIVLYAR